MRTIGERAQKVIDALRDAGVADEDIQTNDLSVQPVLDDQNHVTGLRGDQHRDRVRIRDLAQGRGASSTPPRRRRATTSSSRASRSRSTTTASCCRRGARQGDQARSRPGRAAGQRRRRRGGRRAVDLRSRRSSVPVRYAGPRWPPRPPSTPIQPGSQTLSVSGHRRVHHPLRRSLPPRSGPRPTESTSVRAWLPFRVAREPESSVGRWTSRR